MSQTNSQNQEAEKSEQNAQAEAGSKNEKPNGTALSPEAALQSALKQAEEKYVYLYADFENYKKRTIKERSDLVKFGWESTARELLQIVDNLERAIQHMPTTTDKTLADGLKMILEQFQSTLEKSGVKHIQTHKAPFDPHFHEAVAQSVSDHPPGIILEEQGRGYTLHGRLLRPARVVVSAGGESSAEAPAQENTPGDQNTSTPKS